MAKAGKTVSKTFVWILMAMLIVGLAGFGATNLGGTIRSIGSVGDKSISVDEYARTLQEDMRALSAQVGQTVPFATAEQLGLPRQSLERVVMGRALDHETTQLGLSIGDKNLQEQILQMPGFQGIDGNFDRSAYRFALENAGLSESEFEESLREEASRTLVQAAILSGNEMPEIYSETIVSFLAERRNATVARLGISELTAEIPAPTDAELQSYYDENIESYTLPETKKISYAWLSPDMIIDTVEVDEETLKQAYAERESEFNTPERRLVERLVFASETEADDAKSRLLSGDATFEALVEERGLSLSDIDLGDVSKDALGAAGESVFSTNTGDVAGPAPSDLGPALFRVNGILNAQSRSFEDAKPELRDALAADRARRVVEAQASDIDDLLAGGATLEDLAKETDMQIGQIDWFDGAEDDIAGYEAFRAAAQAVKDTDFPQVEILEDGGIFAMRLDDVLEPRPQPLEEVKDRVAAGWETRATRAALRAQAEALLPQITSDGDLASLGLSPDTLEGLTRRGLPGELPASAVQALFDAKPGDVSVIEDVSTVLILRLDSIEDADLASDDNAALIEQYSAQASSALGQDLFSALAADIQNRAGIQIDQNAINAVHASFQ